MTRNSEITRATSETSVECRLDLDGVGTSDVKTGLGFLDHMLTALAKHSRIDLTLLATGDTEVDDHHTVEDCAIVLGRALNEALGERSGITRFGYSYAPLDESLSRAVVDLSGRPWPEINLSLTRDTINDVASENLTHFFCTLAKDARMALHVDVIRGDNDHHKAESAFKAVALALREAVVISSNEVPSTKGSLT
jgi:imidazoleglycerol phosphate dehydratase HisB